MRYSISSKRVPLGSSCELSLPKRPRRVADSDSTSNFSEHTSAHEIKNYIGAQSQSQQDNDNGDETDANSKPVSAKAAVLSKLVSKLRHGKEGQYVAPFSAL